MPESRPAELTPALVALLGSHAPFVKPRWLRESAWVGHTPFAFSIMEMHRPGVFVELGTHWGVSHCAFCQAVDFLGLATRCSAVDTWKGDEHAGYYPEQVLAELRAHHDPLYGSFSQLVPDTFEDALNYFADGTIDLLHIDGCHYYEAVKKDFESWLPKLSRRGVVLMHDSRVQEREFGVGPFVEELRGRFPVFEFTHSYGLAVVGVGGELAGEPVWELVNASEPATAVVRRFYASLGERIMLEQEADRLRGVVAARDAELKSTLADFDITRAEAERIAKELYGTRDELHGVQGELQGTRLELANTETRLAETREEVARIESELAQAEGRYAAVINSRTWRLSSPLRRIGGGLAESLRNFREKRDPKGS